jgi:tetratricopeptide (TPR) repeat protein
MAQEATPIVSPPDDSREPVESAVARAEQAADRAEEAANEARDFSSSSVDLASGLFGLFEGITGVVGLLVPLLIVAGGVLGFRRLGAAENELTEARERLQQELEQTRQNFERQVRERQEELDQLRADLERTAEQQRVNAEKAIRALSWLPLGERQYQAKDYAGAIHTYERALELDPDNLIINYRLGYVHTQRGDLQEAEAYLLRTLEVDENFSPGQAALGYVYRRMGERMEEDSVARDMMFNKAEHWLLKALNTTPNLVEDDDESWWGSLGGLYRRRGRLQEAITAYERAGKVTPHSSYPFSNLALLYMQSQNREKMLEMYKEVERLAWNEVQGHPDNYWGYADLLAARLALGKIDEAEAIFETVMGTAPLDSPYMLQSLLDTLTRLSGALTPESATPVREFFARVEAISQERQAILAAQKATEGESSSEDE